LAGGVLREIPKAPPAALFRHKTGRLPASPFPQELFGPSS